VNEAEGCGSPEHWSNDGAAHEPMEEAEPRDACETSAKTHN